MSQIAVELALRHLLDIRPAGGNSTAAARPDPLGPTRTEKLMRSAAALMEALESAGAGADLRRRAALVDRETAAGTPFDEARKDFIRLFAPPEELPLPPLPDDFGTLRDERHSYVTFPSALRVVQAQTAEYKLLVPELKATRDCRCPPVPWPDTEVEQSKSKRGRRKKRVADGGSGGPVAGNAASPIILAEAWVAQLHRLAVLADSERFWGCHLILLCHAEWRPGSGNFATAGWLYRHLERQADEALGAIQGAAAAVAAGGTSPEQPQPAEVPQTSHSDDFRAVVWFGTPYTFTNKQAPCVGCLWSAWEKKWPGVSKADLLRACESDGTEVKDLFKGHAAWGTMIVSVRKGLYSLRPPADPQ